MKIDVILNICILFIGLYFAIRFRSLGKSAMEFQKKLNRMLPLQLSETNFGAGAVVFSQYMFLVIGILFFCVGFAKLFK